MNALCGQNVEFVNVKACGTYSDHWAVRIVTTGLQRVKPSLLQLRQLAH